VHLKGVEEMTLPDGEPIPFVGWVKDEPYCWEFCGTTFYDKEECFAWWEQMKKADEMLSSHPPIPLYGTPQTKEWQYLTDAEIKEIVGGYGNEGGIGGYTRELFDKIEAKIKEKNVQKT
jgi:hypothetical protein